MSAEADAQPRGRIAVDYDAGIQAFVLLISVDVAELRHRTQLLKKPGRPGIQFVQIFALQGVLVLRLALAAADCEILRRLHE